MTPRLLSQIAQVLFISSDCTDKGKPAVRQGHKAVSLIEIVWLPKAIGEKPVVVKAVARGVPPEIVVTIGKMPYHKTDFEPI